ncbi:MAG TPA: copper resistance system multicopper oxidase [Gammaproteobacteria bacterium]|nr:copper resistance system multicopper oxidase [Gammaproteobacteria bacterium]
MSHRPTLPGTPPHFSRRTFLEGLSIGAAAGLAVPSLHAAGAVARAPDVLHGADVALRVGAAPVNFTGRQHIATVVNDSLPAPTLRWREGDTVSVRVTNALAEPTSIHWHGLVLPANMDGVPGLSFHGIAPGETFTYRFPLRQSGTYWYHAHSGFQEQTGLYGAIVIEPREPAPFAYDREHVVLFSDWTDRDPLALYLKLKRQADYFNYQKRTLGDYVRDVRRDGLAATRAAQSGFARMRMNPADLADVTGATYTYLTNGRTPAGNWTGLFRPGERVLLRLIAGASMSTFDVRIPGLAMTVVAVDGQYVHPVTVDEIRMAAAETYDVLVTPAGADAFTIFAQSIDRSGYARGTLAVRDGLEAPVPAMDRIVYLGMADMGHDMAAHSEHSGAAESAPAAGAHAGHAAAGADAGHAAHAGHDMAMAAAGTHPPSERRNPGIDMRAMAPTPRLDDPGVGLRDNGRRVLTYADLHSLFRDPDGRAPARTLTLHLTGHMERFMWSFDGVPYAHAEPIALRYGERVRFTLVNDTMMAHPIHLHGLWSDLEDERGAFLVRKHTVNVPPGTVRSYRVTADALGRWAYHCHLLYHMNGMFREVRVDA